MEAMMKSMKKEEIEELEIRPGGMLVQKRDPDSEPNLLTFPVVPMIRVKVKFGSSYHSVSISSQASFGKAFSFSI
ncbi:BAG family molecular chaperone regulator 1 [Linum perenne]